MKQNIHAAVVVYNKTCTDSLTCAALAEIMDMDIHVLIYDNSTKDYGNQRYCEERGWTYLGGEGNKGLSAAYNACIDCIKGAGGSGWLCLFDDDTDLTSAYFQRLREAVDSGGEIFAPFIYSNGRILSPCRIDRRYQTTLFPDEQAAFAYTGSDLTAINSGMAVALSIFDDYRYDEHIFLDGIDHTFIRDMAARGIRLRLLDYSCEHQFSGDSKPSKGASITRFQIFSKDFAYILRNRKADYWYLVGKRAIHLTLQYRTLVFLGIFFRRLPN